VPNFMKIGFVVFEKSTRLNPFARSSFYNATAMRSKFNAIFRDFSVFSPKKIIGGLAPLWVRRCKLHVPRYRLVKVS